VHKILVFINGCNRLLGESIAHILNKRAEFHVSSALTVEKVADASGAASSIVVLDSLQVLDTYKTKLWLPPHRASELRSILIAMQDGSQTKERMDRLRLPAPKAR
jgi:hypothetical protein